MSLGQPTGSAGPTALHEWRIGWLLVLSAMVAFGSASVYSFSLGLFIAPLQDEFGWSRGAITGGMLLSATLTAIGAPFFGRLIDIYGSRRIGIPGMAIYRFAVAMLGTTSGWIWNWRALWLRLSPCPEKRHHLILHKRDLIPAQKRVNQRPCAERLREVESG